MGREKKKASMTREETIAALEEELARTPSGTRTQYVHEKKTLEELRNAEKGMDKKINMTGVRRAVEETEGHEVGSDRFVYKVSDNIRTNADENARRTTLHGSLGTKLINKGEHVFELSIAGSGFKEFRKMHHHSPGKSAFIGNTVDNDKKTMLEMGKPKDGYAVKEAKGRLEALLVKLYGEKVVRNGQEVPYTRKKVVNGKVKYSLPGPGQLDGSDKKRSIDALRHNTLEFAKEYLTDIFASYDRGEKEKKPINLLLKGHSRGGVAIGEAMQMIQHWVHKEHPEYEDLVKYDLIQLDPVPGTDRKKTHKELNLTEKTVTDLPGTAERFNTEYRKNVSSTVFYSMNVNEDIKHKLFFDPQAVYGANRVILCPMSHTLHLGSVDNTQADGLSKVGFTFAGNGEKYRGSGINELGDGVYVMDETATMVKVKSPKQLEAILAGAMPERVIGQGYRRETLQAVADKWFEAHPTPLKERQKIVSRDMGPFMDRVTGLEEGTTLRKAGEEALQGRIQLASLACRKNLTDADRKLAGACISKMVLFEIASRSQMGGQLTENFGKLSAALEKTEEITSFTKDCTSEDLVGFFDRAGEKVFCRNMQIRNNQMSLQKVAAPQKKAVKPAVTNTRPSVTSSKPVKKSGGKCV